MKKDFMKKNSLQLRLTLLSSILLTLACVLLTASIRFSANKMITPEILSPALSSTESLPMTSIISDAKKISFQTESLWAMILIVVIGTLSTYFLVGYTLRPIKNLTKDVKNKRVDNLTDEIQLPKSKDEVYDLTLAFNDMSKHLEHAFTLQKQFSADVAHELRTPLAVMQANLEVQILSTSETQETKELLSQIQRLQKLIDDLLWFSKDTPLEHVVRLNVHDILADIIEEMQEDFSKKHQTITLSNQNLFLKGNDALLERVFYNLLQNANKYSDEHTSIKVCVNEKERSLSICDQGHGIPDQEKALVFEPFYRMDKSRSRKIGGNGLGLAICKKILNKHNANISVLDNTPHGTIFKITFQS